GVTADETAGRVDDRHDGRSIVERYRRQHLQRHHVAAARHHGARAATFEAQPEEAVASDARRRRDHTGAGSNRSRRTQSRIASTPSPLRRFVKTNGRSPRWRRASRAITARSAPTWGARSILLMTSRSERRIPGPPLRGIFSPSATSIT